MANLRNTHDETTRHMKLGRQIRHEQQEQWIAPPAGTYKINIDASFNASNGGCGKLANISSPLQAEVTDDDRLRWRSRAQEPKRVLRSGKTFSDDWEFIDPFAPTTFMDVLNASPRIRPPLSEELKLLSIEGHQQRMKDLQQHGRHFMERIIEYISSNKEHYKFIIVACKENADLVMELGFISSYNRDEIRNGLDRIDDEISKGRFEWRENKDVRSNIVEALVDRVGEPARKLEATISQHFQKLTILRLWVYDSADKIITQMKQLQVELVLLALRNWGFILPRILGRTDWILLGDLILSKVELVSKIPEQSKLDRDVSQLRSCKNKIESTLHNTLSPGSTDGLSEDGSHLMQNAIINFGNIIIGDIAINLSSLEREMCSWMSFGFLTPNDKVTESVSLLGKHVSDLDKLTAIRRDSLTCNGIQDVSQRFLSVYVIVRQILKVAADFGRNASFDHEKVEYLPSIGSIKTSGSSDFRTFKVRDQDQCEKKKGEDEIAMVMQDFRSRNDETMKRLFDWLAKHQTAGGDPLKFCTFYLSRLGLGPCIQ
ncbi:hypothetical protein ACP70R_023090 [Stipagrostis hirtigluma subsp. patula]